MPDAASQTNQVLGDMRFPQLSSLLPYRDYDESSGLFINDGSIGFMLEVQPLTGASPTEVMAIESLLRTKLPRGVPFSIHLMSSKRVGDLIEYGLRDFSWSGREAEKFNAINGPEGGGEGGLRPDTVAPEQTVPANGKSTPPASTAATAPAGGREDELLPKPPPKKADAERGDLPPGIDAEGEIVDVAQYEAWQAEQDGVSQQSLQRREEVNINIDRHRRELNEVSRDEVGDNEPWEDLHR